MGQIIVGGFGKDGTGIEYIKNEILSLIGNRPKQPVERELVGFPPKLVKIVFCPKWYRERSTSRNGPVK